MLYVLCFLGGVLFMVGVFVIRFKVGLNDGGPSDIKDVQRPLVDSGKELYPIRRRPLWHCPVCIKPYRKWREAFFCCQKEKK